jgi:hypothetical protein
MHFESFGGFASIAVAFMQDVRYILFSKLVYRVCIPFLF